MPPRMPRRTDQRIERLRGLQPEASRRRPDAASEQRLGVEVLRADPHRDMDRRSAAVEAASSDDITGGDDGTPGHGDLREVTDGTPKPAAMVDRHGSPTSDRPGPCDLAGERRSDVGS